MQRFQGLSSGIRWEILMRKQAVIGLSLVLVLLAGPPAWGQRDKKAKEDKSKAVVVAGKNIQQWIKALEGKEALARVQAINALIQAGPEARLAVPALIAAFRDKDATFIHPLAAVALSRIGADAVPPLEKVLADDAYAVRSGAALALGLIGSPARSATLALAGLLKDREALVRTAAAQALGRIGSLARAGVPGLRLALTDKDASVRVESAAALWKVVGEARGVSVLAKALEDPTVAERAAAILGEMGASAKAALPSLKSALRSKSGRLRIAAVEALYRVSKDAEPALPVLETLLEAKEPSERLSAISALGTVGADPRAVALLVGLLKSKDADTRREAACALAEQGVALEKAIPALEAGLHDRDPGVRWWCAAALAASEEKSAAKEEAILRVFRSALFRAPDREPGKVIQDVQGPAGIRGAAALASVLRTRSVALRIAAARSLAGLGLDARPAQSALVDALKNPDKDVRRAAAEALGQMGTEVLPVLVRLLGNADSLLREGAARALGQMGLPARSAVKALEKLRKDPISPVRTQVALALWSIDQNASDALRTLKLVLADVDNKDRWEAIEAVGIISVEARPPIRGLLEVVVTALKDRDARVRTHAAKWLFRRTREAREVAPFLREGVTDRDVFTRVSCVEALGELGAEGRAVPLLAAALEDKNLAVRLAAEEALARGGPAVVPQLLESLKSKSAKVRLGVARALGLIGPAAKSARSALEALKRDKDPGVRQAAEEALWAIEGVKAG
jgi:HEAT repeat protein